MKARWAVAVVPGCILALFALLGAQSGSDTQAADEAAIRAITETWFSSYAAGNVESIVALYADDAVYSPPGAPAARGHAAIREFLTKDIAAAAGTTTHPNPKTNITISGNLAVEWGSTTITDKSGATVDRVKYMSAYVKKDGKWLIIHDMYNSDGPMQAGKQ